MEKEKINILYVEDNPNDAAIMEEMLDEQCPMAFSLAHAELLAAGLERLDRGGVDIILLDLSLPDSHGFSTFQEVKKRARDLPVIIMTGLNDETLAMKAVQEGAQDYLVKGQVNAILLMRTIRYAIEREKLLVKLRDALLKVNGLHDQLATAYQHINSLLSHGQQLTSSFDPLHYDVMTGVCSIIKQLIIDSPQSSDNPQLVLISLQKAGHNALYSCRLDADHNLTLDKLAAEACDILSRMVGTSQVVWLNQADLNNETGTLLHAVLAKQGLVLFNLVCHLSETITLCAMNYGREVTSHDAEVLNSVAAQTIFLSSLAAQVRETEDAFAYMAYALARAAEANDDDTGNHIKRVGEYSALLAGRMGLSNEFISLIRLQGIMHDVGKVHTPSVILKKPGRLEAAEFEVMQQHCLAGATIIGNHVRLTMAKNIALCHHERYDGNGYPQGLRGEQIPLEARILTLADQYDALRNKRCYKPSFDHDTAYRIIVEGDGRTTPQHFDPQVLQAFREVAPRFAETYATSQG